ncbi:MAG: hypothetical protein IJH75_09020 [Mogibacterium sp.]|nr:hypothetical protein [Mogibacterium sp.]
MNERELYVDNDNDKYFGDLPLFNKRRQLWSESHPKYRLLRSLTIVVLLLGFAVIVYTVMKDPNLDHPAPTYLSILITAALTLLCTRYGKKQYEQPFHKFQSARFEATDDGLYYIYQKGMTLNTYLIRDKNIRSIIRDDEASALLVLGDADLQVQDRKGTSRSKVDRLYMLVPFDEFDLDDLLEPYGSLVSVEPGTLRQRYLREH